MVKFSLNQSHSVLGLAAISLGLSWSSVGRSLKKGGDQSIWLHKERCGIHGFLVIFPLPNGFVGVCYGLEVLHGFTASFYEN